MAKSGTEIIYEDLQLYAEKYGVQFVFILCAVALKELMGLENWNEYIKCSFKDPDFKKLIVERLV